MKNKTKTTKNTAIVTTLTPGSPPEVLTENREPEHPKVTRLREEYERDLSCLHEASIRDEEDKKARLTAKFERLVRMHKANTEARMAEEALMRRLEDEFGLSNHPKNALLWSKAWDLGHSAGLDEVEIYYRNLVELIV